MVVVVVDVFLVLSLFGGRRMRASQSLEGGWGQRRSGIINPQPRLAPPPNDGRRSPPRPSLVVGSDLAAVPRLGPGGVQAGLGGPPQHRPRQDGGRSRHKVRWWSRRVAVVAVHHATGAVSQPPPWTSSHQPYQTPPPTSKQTIKHGPPPRGGGKIIYLRANLGACMRGSGEKGWASGGAMWS